MSKKEIKDIAITYYSRKDVQKTIFNFCQNRETVPRHMDHFGKRPDILEYPSDVLQHVKKGFTSFNCSEELWEDPLALETGLSNKELNKQRIGWDLLIDIDCKWFDYSKMAAEAIVKTLEDHGVDNIGIKFSGSKGFHIIVPWKAFPKTLGDKKTKNMFPELPRKIATYIRSCSEKIMDKSLSNSDLYSNFKGTDVKKGIKCKNCNEIAEEYIQLKYICPICKREELKRLRSDSKKSFKCPECGKPFEIKDKKTIYECRNCDINSEENPDNFSKEYEIDLFDLMGLDIILVSQRHLFRAPYSLHEKGLASIVIDKDKIKDFHPKQARPLKVKVRDFYPKSEEGEARELVVSALDWHEREEKKEEKKSKNYENREINIDKSRLVFPPCIKKIMKGLKDGKKRALFILINYFKSIGLNPEELEKKINKWNERNDPGLKQGYIRSQLNWHKRKKKILPPNCDKENYKAIGVCEPDSTCSRIKNPVNYSVIKTRSKKKSKKSKNKNNKAK